MNNNVLKAKKLNRFLGTPGAQVHVLRDISIDLESSNVYSIAGTSGSGKSSLLYVLGLLDQPDSGEIWVHDQQINHNNDQARTSVRNQHIGFVFQFHFLLTEFTALENVMLPMKKHGSLTPSEMKERAHQLLMEVGLEDKTHRQGNQLSGGEQQRVAIARALANNPSIIFADEPTGNLDARNSTLVFELLNKVAHEHNQAVLIVTHNQDIAKNCDHTLRMQDGVFI